MNRTESWLLNFDWIQCTGQDMSKVMMMPSRHLRAVSLQSMASLRSWAMSRTTLTISSNINNTTATEVHMSSMPQWQVRERIPRMRTGEATCHLNIGDEHD